MSEVIALPSQVATEAEFDGVPVDLVEAFKRDQERAKKATDWLSSATPDQLAAFEAFQTIQAAEQAKKAEAKQKAEAEKAAKAQKAEDEKAAKQEAAERARQGAAGTEMTDAVLSQRVSDSVMAGLHCWSASLGWMTWHRTHWERSNSETVIENVRKFMLDSVTKELRSPDTDWRKRQELMSLLSKSRINAIVELCKGITQVRDDMFDSHPDLLNTLNCVVNLRTGEVRQHDPAFYFTKVTPVPYIKGATHPDWDMALQAVPEKAREWFQVRAGQGITGHMTPDDVLLMLQGGGENGKSTVLDAIGRAIGPGYKVGVSDRVLLAEAGAHPTELMDFRGARFAVAEELPEGRRMSVKRLKDVIGTPTMKARYMRQDTVEWDSTHSMFLSTNYLPVIEETDHGTWRRLLLLQFPFKFLKPGQEPKGPNERVGDPGLRVRLKQGKQQRAAVLAWLVEGATRWYQADRVMPQPPTHVVEATRKWRKQSDLILSYWDNMIEADPNSHVMARDLFDAFNAWLTERGHAKWADKTFVARFEGHDETSGNAVERRKIRQKPNLSRPALVTSMLQPPAVPATYWAWVGVRFVVDGVKMDDAEDM